jgi:hypothetical protein
MPFFTIRRHGLFITFKNIINGLKIKNRPIYGFKQIVMELNFVEFNYSIFK